jgi:anti-anti-sigma regulatory factor
MLKITTIKTDRRCRLVLEGELVAPWAEELEKKWRKVRISTRGLPLIVDLRNVITISQEGKDVLLEMMNDGVRFICCGVLNRHVLQQLTRKAAL